MCLFLPHEKDGLPALVERVCTEPGFLDHHLPNTRVRVGDFRIPKFKITSSFEASQVLKELGLVLPFEVDPYNGGNLTEMVDLPPGEVPLVSSLFHKSFIEVNENGYFINPSSKLMKMERKLPPLLSPQRWLGHAALVIVQSR
ncbi:hypothetical protein FF1_018825 [Malus domestica]